MFYYVYCLFQMVHIYFEIFKRKGFLDPLGNSLLKKPRAAFIATDLERGIIPETRDNCKRDTRSPEDGEKSAV